MLKNIIKILAELSMTLILSAIVVILTLGIPSLSFYPSAFLGLLGLFAYYRPLPQIFLGHRFTALTMIVISCLCAVATGIVASQREAQLAQEIAEKKRIRLIALKASDPKSYLAELKSSGDRRWEEELKTLDKVEYDKLVAERAAQEALERQKTIKTLNEKLTTTKTTEIDQLRQIYSDLASADPTKTEYRTKAEALTKQISERNAAADLLQLQMLAPERFVKLVNFTWSKEGFGNVMMANFNIKNDLPWPIKDITIRCEHSAASGTKIDANTQTIYQRIEPNKQKRLAEINMGFIHSQSARTSCDISHVVAVR